MAFRTSAARLLPLALCTGALAQNCSSILVPRVDGPSGPQVRYMGAGDFNHDGLDDLVAAQESGVVRVYFSLGGGAFSAPVVTNLGARINANAFRIGDVTGDGIPDLYGDLFDPQLGVLPQRLFVGRPDGTFTPGPIFQTTFFLTAFGDFNGDGLPDVIGFQTFTGGRPPELRLFLNQGGGSFLPISLGTAFQASGTISVGDFNDDGRLDFVVVYRAANLTSSQAFFQRPPTAPGGVGSFAPQPINTLANNGAIASIPYLIDITGDGIPDLVGPLPGTNFLAFSRGLGAGAFAPREISPPAEAEGRYLDLLNGFAVADVNGDGLPDIIRHMWDGAGVLPTNVFIEFNLDGGRFSSPVRFEASAPAAGQTATLGAVAVGDFDGDGLPDIIADSVVGPYSLLRGSAPGQINITAPPTPRRTRPGQSATFSVSAEGATSFRWLKDGKPLTPADAQGRITGMLTPTLTIAATQPSDSGVYTVEASNRCSNRTASAYLDTAALDCALVDINLDGFVDPDDLADYIAAYFQGCP